MIALVLSAMAAPTCDELPDAEKSAVTTELLGIIEGMRKGAAVRKDQVKRIRQLDGDRHLCTPDDAMYAAAILTTTFDPDLLRRAYDLAVKAQKGRVVGAELLVAQAYDRLLVSQDLGQVFLTQRATDKRGNPCLYAVGEVADDAKRATYGLGPAEPIFAAVIEGSGRKGDPVPATLEKWGLYCKPVGSQAQKAKR